MRVLNALSYLDHSGAEAGMWIRKQASAPNVQMD